MFAVLTRRWNDKESRFGASTELCAGHLRIMLACPGLVWCGPEAEGSGLRPQGPAGAFPKELVPLCLTIRVELCLLLLDR